MTFLEKYELLKKSVPVPAVFAPYSINSEYADNNMRGKNCYYCFDGYYYENCMYTGIGAYNKWIVDCIQMELSEKCYETIDSTRCYGSSYLIECNSCNDCHFSAFLNSCADCFGCVGLTHKKYCVFNKQYSKEEYFKKVEELKKEKPEKILAQMLELKQTVPHPASQQSNNENCPYGNNIHDSKNCFWAFNIYYFDNCGYVFNGSYARNCWDSYLFGGNPGIKTVSELCYQQVYTETCYNCAFLIYCENCTNCHYSSYLRSCTDCFGCVGLTKKKYCILNNQLTKDQYEKALKEIKRELGWKF